MVCKWPSEVHMQEKRDLMLRYIVPDIGRFDRFFVLMIQNVYHKNFAKKF